MKKFIQLLALASAVVSAGFLQSCNEDEVGAAPTVELDATSGSNTPGNSVTITATVNAPNGGELLNVFVNGAEAESYEIGGERDFTQEFTYQVPANAVIGSTIIVSFQAVDRDDYPSAVANFVLTVGDPVVRLQGTLASQTLSANTQYLLVGQVFIPNGVTLTIPAGTIIKGDKASKAVLVVQPGGQLVANGTSTNPVVFTSAQNVGERDRGDWGGIVILGNAWVNQAALPSIEGISPAQTYGNITSPATNATANSGTLNYVRVEYAGIELTPNNETNSVTFGGVGSGTTVSYVQVSFGGDDGFEWFGGSVNGKYLVSHSTWDDDFDTDFGWGGNVQFGLVVRNPFFADQSGSNAFESDNQGNANDTPSGAAGYTRGVFSNITVLGPRDISSRSLSANYQNAMHIRRRSALSIFNSVFAGFRTGLRIDDQATLDNLTGGTSKLAYNLMIVPGTSTTGTTSTQADAAYITGLSSGDATAVRTYWEGNNNSLIVGSPAFAAADARYTDAGLNQGLFWGGSTASNYPSNPSFVLLAGANGAANNLNTGANFTDAKVSGAFFTATTYRGAFGTTDWTDGWAEFQPLNKVY